MILPVAFLILGFLFLLKGADWLVEGASSLARSWGISSIAIGLTVVAFGTSMPELVVNLMAAVNGDAEIAIGNIVGSNLANIFLILGLAGCVTALTVQRSTVWKEIPLALLSSVLILVMANDTSFGGTGPDALDRVDGMVLIAFFVIFLSYTFGIARAEGGAPEVKRYPTGSSWIRIAGGLALLIAGGKLAVEGAVGVATILGVSERIIALTIVAVGTSLPELMTSVVAAYRGQADIAIGNVVGSNIFNVFWILGLSAIIRPLPFSPANAIDTAATVAASALLFLAMFVGRRHLLQRWQAAGFLTLYVGYIGVASTLG